MKAVESKPKANDMLFVLSSELQAEARKTLHRTADSTALRHEQRRVCSTKRARNCVISKDTLPAALHGLVLVITTSLNFCLHEMTT